MSYPVMPLGFLGSQGDQDTYRIERSLRFNSADSAYLSRTPSSSGSRTTATLSFWVKRSKLGSYGSIIGGTTYNSVLYFDETPVLNGLSLIDNSTGTTYPLDLRTTQVFRDPSAWYHIVINWDSGNATSSDRARIYVNGSRITSFNTAVYPTQNYNFTILSNDAMRIGDRGFGSIPFDGYLTEINFIDGQAMTPSSFGETDAITGRWKAKAYSGTYGTNGFYLKFADNSGTTATTLGKDSSPNGNNWTPNNFSVTAGAGNDSLVDSPTNYGTDTGVGGEVRGNYCTLNPLAQSSSVSLANGNLDFSATAANSGGVISTISVSSGKWYWEVTPTSGTLGFALGVAKLPLSSYGANQAGTYLYLNSGSKRLSPSTDSAYGASYTDNDVIGVALDMNAGTVVFYKNNSSQGTAFSGLSGDFSAWVQDGSASSACVANINFGQRPFAYTAPSGFKALCTTNLPQPIIQKPSKYFDVVTRTSDGASNYTKTGLEFSPDLIWTKDRTSAYDHVLWDTVRGATKYLNSNTTSAELIASQLASFNSDGYTINYGMGQANFSTDRYVDWIWDEAPIAGMDIVSYTGNGTGLGVAHSLGVAPAMYITKSRSNTTGWYVYHKSLSGNALYLNSTAASVVNTGQIAAFPSGSSFSPGNHADVNTNNATYITYLFAEVEGFSKFGSYTGNGSTDGPFVYCGFRPRWVMIKSSSVGGSAGYDWIIHDTQRSVTNVSDTQLIANGSQAENQDSGGSSTAGSSLFDLTSNGFKIRTSTAGRNQSGQTFIFAAFAETAFRYARAR